MKKMNIIFISLVGLFFCSFFAINYTSGSQYQDQQLFYALMNNTPREVQKAIENGANVELPGKRETALLITAENGRKSITDILLIAGANIHATNAIGSTPLMLASLYGHPSIVRKLIRAGSNLNAKNIYGHTALQNAVSSSSRRKEKVVQELLRHGAFPDTRSMLPREKALINRNEHLYDQYIVNISHGLDKQLSIKDLQRLTGEFIGVEKLPEQVQEIKVYRKSIRRPERAK